MGDREETTDGARGGLEERGRRGGARTGGEDRGSGGQEVSWQSFPAGGGGGFGRHGRATGREEGGGGEDLGMEGVEGMAGSA